MMNVVSNYFKEIPKFHFKCNNNYYTVDEGGRYRTHVLVWLNFNIVVNTWDINGRYRQCTCVGVIWHWWRRKHEGHDGECRGARDVTLDTASRDWLIKLIIPISRCKHKRNILLLCKVVSGIAKENWRISLFLSYVKASALLTFWLTDLLIDIIPSFFPY